REARANALHSLRHCNERPRNIVKIRRACHFLSLRGAKFGCDFKAAVLVSAEGTLLGEVYGPRR
ncbi:MAG: hypothetical protein WCD40_20530, partial [Candidatus Acidiferrales bacterium]